MSRVIRLSCEGSGKLSLNEFEVFQGDLKKLPEKNYEKLKKQIIDHGFASPILIWWAEKKILDGTQRLVTIKKMIKEGYSLPDNQLPYVKVFPKDKAEAKKILLSFVSQYGQVNDKGLYDFINDIEDYRTLLDDYDIPNFDLDAFDKKFINDEIKKVEDDDLDELFDDVDDDTTPDDKGNLKVDNSLKLVFDQQLSRRIDLIESLNGPENIVNIAYENIVQNLEAESDESIISRFKQG